RAAHRARARGAGDESSDVPAAAGEPESGGRSDHLSTGQRGVPPEMSEAADLVHLEREPYYLPLADEVEIFTAAYQARLPVLLKGPTGCGKTRFVEHMTWRLYRAGRRKDVEVPLVTISCHEDLTATDMVGRFLLDRKSTRLNSS